jgi:SAM-dependent methyltransferase
VRSAPGAAEPDAAEPIGPDPDPDGSSRTARAAGPTVPAPESLLFGAARALVDAGAVTAVHDLYDTVGASFYDALVGASTADLVDVVRAARAAGGPVLDLACGTGRLTIPLARRGFEVTGLDLSPAMLGRLRDRLNSSSPDVAGRVTVVWADMTTLDLPGRFGCAILGATSVVLLDPAARRRLFAAVGRHLADGGLFVFDHPVHDLHRLSTAPEWLDVIPLPAPAPGGTAFAFCIRRFDVPRRLEDVNFIVEHVAADGAATRSVVTTRKHLFSPDELVEDLRRAGLHPVGGRRAGAGGRFAVEVRTCRKAG